MTAPCGVPLLRFDHASIFEHACRQPFGNQPDDSPVANPVLDRSSQPVTADLVDEKLTPGVLQSGAPS